MIDNLIKFFIGKKIKKDVKNNFQENYRFSYKVIMPVKGEGMSRTATALQLWGGCSMEEAIYYVLGTTVEYVTIKKDLTEKELEDFIYNVKTYRNYEKYLDLMSIVTVIHSKGDIRGENRYPISY